MFINRRAGWACERAAADHAGQGSIGRNGCGGLLMVRLFAEGLDSFLRFYFYLFLFVSLPPGTNKDLDALERCERGFFLFLSRRMGIFKNYPGFFLYPRFSASIRVLFSDFTWVGSRSLHLNRTCGIMPGKMDWQRPGDYQISIIAH